MHTRLRVRAYAHGNWAGALGLARREIKRDFQFVADNLIGPPIQTLLFGLIFVLVAGDGAIFTLPDGGESVVAFIAPGLMIIALGTRCFEAMAFAMVYDKMERIIDDTLSAPLSAGEILAGYMMHVLAVAAATALPVALVLWTIGAPAPASWPATLAALGGAGLLFGLVGFVAGVASDKWDQMQAKETFMLTPLLYLSGGLFPIDTQDGAFLIFALVNPLTYVTDLTRLAMTGASVLDPALSVAVLAGLIAILTAIAWVILQRGWRLKA